MATEGWTKVQVFRVRALCEAQRAGKACGGELEFTGMSRPMIPPTYRHRCKKCGAEEWLKDHYPTIKYQEVTGG